MTLNHIIDKLIKPLAEEHLQVNEFGFGDLFNHATTRTVKYPLMWVVFNNVSYGNKAFNYSFSLVFADIVKSDLSNVLEIQSDMIQVAADIAAWLRDTDDNDLEIQNDFSFKPFSEKFTDHTSGIVLDIKISSLQALSACEAPFKSNI